jgi:hypothetical protein
VVRFAGQSPLSDAARMPNSVNGLREYLGIEYLLYIVHKSRIRRVGACVWPDPQNFFPFGVSSNRALAFIGGSPSWHIPLTIHLFGSSTVS